MKKVVESGVRAVRGAVSLTFFALFGLFGLILTPVVLVLRKPELCQPVVRTAWRVLVGLFTLTRLIRVETTGLRPLRGTVIVANHPSLIDVVILVALVPRTLYIAKHALRGNPFLSAIVWATSLPDDARLPTAAVPYLKRGWNVLVFPEGTRSPLGGGLHPFRRGAAHVALETGAPVVPVSVGMSARILAKSQRPWQMTARPVAYAFRFGEALSEETKTAKSDRKRAILMTEKMRHEVEDHLPPCQTASVCGILSQFSSLKEATLAQ